MNRIHTPALQLRLVALLALLVAGISQAADPAPAATPDAGAAATPAGKKPVGSGASSFAAAANAAVKGNGNGNGSSDSNNNELSTNVIGSQEAPTVLNVVPWKDKEVKVEKRSPTLSILNNLLQPLDRDVLQREVQYFRSLQEQKSQ